MIKYNITIFYLINMNYIHNFLYEENGVFSTSLKQTTINLIHA